MMDDLHSTQGRPEQRDRFDYSTNKGHGIHIHKSWHGLPPRITLNWSKQDDGASATLSVPLPPSALAASQRAHARHMGQLGVLRQLKRPKWRPPVSVCFKPFWKFAFNIACRKLLDIADMAWMRLDCKSMGKIAARMAQQKIEMGISVLFGFAQWEHCV